MSDSPGLLSQLLLFKELFCSRDTTSAVGFKCLQRCFSVVL